MSPFAHMLAASVLLGTAAWASNIWPGLENWWRAALSRFLWWGLPFTIIALLCDVPPNHASILGAAAWLGAWIPHTSMPDLRSHSAAMVIDLIVALLRVAMLLSFPTAVFWTCGAFWFGMVFAAVLILPCILVGNTKCLNLGWPGLDSPRHVAGTLFGATTGFCVALCILTPDPLPDLLM